MLVMVMISFTAVLGNDVLVGGDGDRIVGDVNRDGQVNNLDISPYANVLQFSW